MKAYKKRIELLTKALKMCVDALDRLMGDTDVEGDDSPEFCAMQFACKVLDEIDEPHLDPLKPLIAKEQIWGEALAEGKKAKDAFEGLAYALDGYYGRALNSEDEKLNQLWEKAYDAMSALDTYLFIKDD